VNIEVKNSPHKVWPWAIAIFGSLLIAFAVVTACTNGMTGTSSGMSTVNVMLSDPATCQGPNGPYSHVYVTVTDVQANTNASAGSSDSGWVDLTPNLSKSPMQIDLLGQANNQCFLATLGDTQQLQAGTYQQIRILLASNSATVSGNKCGSAANCVMLTADTTNTPHTLLLSSEAQTGIKIPSGQIASGGFTVAAGQTKDLDVDFNTCESIVREGNGQYRLKPVLHAGEVSTSSTSINGTVVDGGTGNPVNGNVTVSLEQKDSGGIDRVLMAQPVNSDGSWVICPVMVGNTSAPYDIVIVGTRSDGILYAPTILTGVSVGSSTGMVKLNPPASALAATSSTNLAGMVNSVNGSAASSPGVAIDVLASALAQVNMTWYTIPLPPTATQTSAELALETVASTTAAPCTPATADCVSYTMQVPSSGAYIGAWSASGAMLNEPAPLGTYEVDAIATSVSTGALDCSTSELQSTSLALTSPVAASQAVSLISFFTCQ
jgi:Domain of unknown function (DUF4382)